MKRLSGKTKRALGIVGTVLMYLFFGLCLVAVIFSISSKRSEDGAVNLFGYELRVVLSPSMEKSEMTDVSAYKIKSIPVKSLTVTERVSEKDPEGWYAELAAGDVLTFRYVVAGRQETITHRIIAIERLTDGYMITLRGDNRTENEGEQVIYTADERSANYVLGKVVYTSSVLGNIVYILQQPVGIALVVIVPAAIIIIFQIARIIAVFGAEKRKRAEAREAKASEELDLLRKRLAELEQHQSESEGGMSETSPAQTNGEAPNAVPANEGSDGPSPAVESQKEEKQ